MSIIARPLDSCPFILVTNDRAGLRHIKEDGIKAVIWRRRLSTEFWEAVHANSKNPVNFNDPHTRQIYSANPIVALANDDAKNLFPMLGELEEEDYRDSHPDIRVYRPVHDDHKVNKRRYGFHMDAGFNRRFIVNYAGNAATEIVSCPLYDQDFLNTRTEVHRNNNHTPWVQKQYDYMKRKDKADILRLGLGDVMIAKAAGDHEDDHDYLWRNVQVHAACEIDLKHPRFAQISNMERTVPTPITLDLT